MRFSRESYERHLARAAVLRRMGVPFDEAGEISMHLEERCKMHHLIGADMIYPEFGMDYDRWADLYRRTALYVGGKHLARLRLILERIDLVVA